MEKDEQLSKKFLQSYLYCDFGAFFVSTIYRQSSAIDGEWFYETFSWELDKRNQRKQHIIADNSGAKTEKTAIFKHYEVVYQLEKTGKFELKDD